MIARALTFIVSLAAVLWCWQASARIEASFLQRSRKLKSCAYPSVACYQAAEKLLKDYQDSRELPNVRDDRYSFLQGHSTEQVVLLVHSFMMRPSEMHEVGEAAAARGLNVFPILLEGHGARSIRYGGTTSMAEVSAEDWLADMEFGVNLAHGFGQKVYIAGYSLGGLLALLQGFADQPAIDGAIAIAPPLGIDQAFWFQRFEFAGSLLAKSDYVVDTVIKKYLHVESETMQMFMKEYVRGVHQVLRLSESANPYAKHAAYLNFRKSENSYPIYLQQESFKRMKVPSVVIASPHDGVVDYKAIQRFVRSTGSTSLLIEDAAWNHIDYGLRYLSPERQKEYKQAFDTVLGPQLQALTEE